MDSALGQSSVFGDRRVGARDESGTRFGSIFAGLLLAIAAASIGWYLWAHRLQPMPVLHRPLLPEAVTENGEPEVRMASGNLAAEVGAYNNELQAYLRFEYLRGIPALGGDSLFLTTGEAREMPTYRLYVLLPNRILRESTRLARLQIRGLVPPFELRSPPRVALENWQRQTQAFLTEYRREPEAPLLALPRAPLTSAVAQFVLFKARTDRRVRRQVEPAYTELLSLEQARQFSSDMIDAAQFYDLPLSMLLGVGAMENNYLNVRGDLDHTVWKRRKQPGDVVVGRRRGWVLVSDSSIGPWQVTRQTLRRAHELYLQDTDTRDYSQLPDRLRPPLELDFDQVSTPVLTTYAALWLRHLLDSCDGDEACAEGAYNGSVQSPNPRYAHGVELVAAYARRVIGVAAGRQGAGAALAAEPH